MSDISFTSGPPETVLDREPEAALNALADAGEDVAAVGRVCMQYPRFLAGWARLGRPGPGPGLRLRRLPHRVPPGPGPAAPERLAGERVRALGP